MKMILSAATLATVIALTGCSKDHGPPPVLSHPTSGKDPVKCKGCAIP